MRPNGYNEDYIVSCCNLYGMIHKKRILFLYQQHHLNETINFDQLDLNYLASKSVYYEKEFYIKEAIFINHEMSKHLDETNGKPFYVPSLVELFSYKDEYTLQESQEQKELFDRVKNLKDEVIASNVVDAVMGFTQIGTSYYAILYHLLNYDFTPKMIDEITPLISDLNNNTRSWINNGYTAYELVQMQINKKNLNKYDPCPCGSGVKYKYCCMNKVFIGEGNPDLYYEDVFKITEEDKRNLKQKLYHENDRIIFHMTFLKDPSIHDLIDDLISKDLTYIIHYDPRLIMGALVKVLFDLNDILLKSELEEKIFRTLHIWLKRSLVDELYDEIMNIIDSLDLPTDDNIMKRLLTLYSEHDYIPKSGIPKKKAFVYLNSLQKTTLFDEKLDEKLEVLSVDLYRSSLKDIATHLYNIIHIYPLAVPAIHFLLEFTESKEEETLLEALIYAYEKTRTSDLSLIEDDFYQTGDHKIYILSLDRLAFIYKHKNQYKIAYPLYEKIINYDKHDRFGAKESVLICYLYLNMMDKFTETLSLLEENSIYTKILNLYVLIEADQPFINSYLDVKNKYQNTLDVLCGITPDDDLLSEPEHFFLDDFYHVLISNHGFINKLRQVHVENIVR